MSETLIKNATQRSKHGISSTPSKLRAERSHKLSARIFWYMIRTKHHNGSFAARTKKLTLDVISMLNSRFPQRGIVVIAT